MSGKQREIEVAPAPALAQALYQVLPWICVPILILSLYFGVFYGYRSYIDTYRYLFWMHFLLQVVFLVSCIGAVTRRVWASQWLRVSGVWCMALVWADIPGLAERTVWRLLYGEPTYLGGASDLMKPHFPPYIYMFGISVFFLALLALTISSVFIHKSRPRASATAPGNTEAGATEYGRLLYGAVLGIFLGLIIYRLDSIVPTNLYLDVVGSYFLVAGVACVLIWHISAQGFFLAGLPICASLLVFLYKPYGLATLALVLWVPIVALGVICFCQQNFNLKVRAIAVSLPVILGLTALSNSFVPVIGPLCFLPHARATLERPPNFPEYLQAPATAERVRYHGGENPYLFFVVYDVYPATDTLDTIFSQLEQAGWKKLDYDLMNPESKSSHLMGWFDRAPQGNAREDDINGVYNNLGARCWSAWWINDKDESICVHLYYESRIDGSGCPTTLCCNLSQYSAKSWMRGYLRNYRHVHQSKP